MRGQIPGEQVCEQWQVNGSRGQRHIAVNMALWGHRVKTTAVKSTTYVETTVELTSAFITAVLMNEITGSQARIYLDQAMELFPSINLVKATHQKVMKLAIKYNTSAYEARHLAIAEEVDTRLVSHDKRLRKAAPDLTISLEEALAQ